MKVLLRIMLDVVAVVCLALAGLVIASLVSGRSIGFLHETWHTPASVGYHTNRGIIADFGLLFFWESEQHPAGPSDTVWWDTEKSTWESAGSPPQFTVSNTRVDLDLMTSMTGYRSMVRTEPDWQGQYHLVGVSPWVLLPICAVVVFVALRAEIARVRKRRRGKVGHCVVCGYDLRGGHDRCPECGTPISPVAATTTT